LQDEYGLRVVQVAFLPLGADLNTAVYRVVADDETPYFVKLRRGVFDETAVALPKSLRDQGIVQIIAPLTTKTGRLWASLDAFKLILYPFVEGHNGFEVDLSDHQWVDFGTALKCIFRSMSTTDSDPCRPPIPVHAVHFLVNVGIGGRLASDSVDGMRRNPEC